MHAIHIRHFLPSNELKKRKQITVSVASKKGQIVLSGKEAAFFVQHLSEDVNHATEFKGIIANKGIVTGIAKIVMKSTDLSKIKVGNILVSSMTRPEMTAAMKIASGFVTDEGGITCHAAIVSRELNKPCIIGTKIATKILKDGDQIEVDATKGIVRIITKSQPSDK
jgi:pyruvate,water dikinase